MPTTQKKSKDAANASSTAGLVKVHESVLAAITKKAVFSIPEVVRIAGSSLVDNLAEIVGARKSFDGAIVIEVKENSVSVEVRIVVRYGCSIPKVAADVQNAIASNITDMTGMQLERINVVVMDLEEEGDSGSVVAE